MEHAPLQATEYDCQYCRHDPLPCARYIVAESLGPAGVPPDLPPFDCDRARRLIADNNIGQA